MPVITLEEGIFPAWCEVKSARLFSLKPDQEKSFPATLGKEMFLVCQGQILVETLPAAARLTEGNSFFLNTPGTGPVKIKSIAGCSLFLKLAGDWSSLSGAGIFTVRNGKPPADDSPYQYWKTTNFDNHYHDCNCYWFVLKGRCQVVTEGKFYQVKPGDCVITGRGWHHDIVSLIYDESATLAWVTGPLEGKKRPGHLWEGTHGKAEPVKERT